MTPGPPPPGSKIPAVGPSGVGVSTGAGRWVRFLDVLAGLLSAGVLLVGIILLLAALIAPAALAAAGLGVANGPGWDRVIAHLAVGAAGELVVLLRHRWSTLLRVLADACVVLAALSVIGWAWLLW